MTWIECPFLGSMATPATTLDLEAQWHIILTTTVTDLTIIIHLQCRLTHRDVYLAQFFQCCTRCVFRWGGRSVGPDPYLAWFFAPCSNVLRGFWDRGRVCGDRSVFVTSHRPAHSSRAHAFSLDRILHFAFEVFPICMALRVRFWLRCSACLLATLFRVSILATLLRGYCLWFDRVFLSSQFASSESPGIIGQHHQPHWLVLRRSLNEPFSVTSHGARPSGRSCVSRTSWRTHCSRWQVIQCLSVCWVLGHAFRPRRLVTIASFVPASQSCDSTTSVVLRTLSKLGQRSG